MPYASWSAPQEYDFQYAPGKDVRLRPIEPEELVPTGALQYLDTMTEFVNEEHVKPAQSHARVPQDRSAKQLTKAQQAAKEQRETADMLKVFSKDPEKFNNMLYLVDIVLTLGCVIPQISSAYVRDSMADTYEKLPMEGRDPEKVYADFIPFNDRMTIFGELTKGLQATKSLPEGSSEDLDIVEAVSDDEDPS